MSLPRLKVRLTRAAEVALKQGHPWVFAGSIASTNRLAQNGDIAAIYDKTDRLLAMALAEANSPIALRVVHLAKKGEPCTISREFWVNRVRQAFALRRDLLADATTSGYRLLHGENDGFPGVVADRYAHVIVVKIYTAAWLVHAAMLREILLEEMGNQGVEHVVLRLSRHASGPAAACGLSEGWWDTTETEVPVLFQENGITFEADVLRGQKTGFFLDQRENRQRVEALAAGRHVLNAFSFSGGFSLYAARGGAASVTDLDLSQHALDSSGRNFTLNSQHPTIASVLAGRRHTVQADAFAWMEQAAANKFGLIITDPPSLAKKESEREGALRRYGSLNYHAIRRLAPRGILVAASCSGHVRQPEFVSSVLSAGRRAGRAFRELWTSGPPLDHPVTFPEAHYLKAVALEMLD